MNGRLKIAGLLAALALTVPAGCDDKKGDDKKADAKKDGDKKADAKAEEKKEGGW